jgi:uncharacterized protein (DUF952 family)
VEILHLLPSGAWRSWGGIGSYEPPSLADEGFVHCTAGDELMLEVANRFYGGSADDLVAVTLETERLTSEVRWEAPRHLDGSEPAPGAPCFPHVYGALDGAAVAGVRRVQRGTGGRFSGYSPID